MQIITNTGSLAFMLVLAAAAGAIVGIILAKRHHRDDYSNGFSAGYFTGNPEADRRRKYRDEIMSLEVALDIGEIDSDEYECAMACIEREIAETEDPSSYEYGINTGNEEGAF